MPKERVIIQYSFDYLLMFIIGVSLGYRRGIVGIRAVDFWYRTNDRLIDYKGTDFFDIRKYIGIKKSAILFAFASRYID